MDIRQWLRAKWQLFVLMFMAPALVREIVSEVGWRGYWCGAVTELYAQVVLREVTND